MDDRFPHCILSRPPRRLASSCTLSTVFASPSRARKGGFHCFTLLQVDHVLLRENRRHTHKRLGGVAGEAWESKEVNP